jgi:hypothetical protein
LGTPVLLMLLSTFVSGKFSSLGLHVKRSDPSRDSYGVIALIAKNPSFSFGFRNMLSDVVWLEAVQTAGNKRVEDTDYGLLARQLNLVADLDPRFTVPYLLGGLVLSESPSHTKDALDLLARGRSSHPNDWRFPFYIGYTQYFSLGETIEAGRSMREAARLPGRPPYLPLLASRMLSEANDPQAALNLLASVAGQETDPVRRSALERRMMEVAVERDIQFLEKAMEVYRGVNGFYPDDLHDLVEAGVIVSIPKEPNGGRYLLERGGKVRSSKISHRLRVFQKK